MYFPPSTVIFNRCGYLPKPNLVFSLLYTFPLEKPYRTRGSKRNRKVVSSFNRKVPAKSRLKPSTVLKRNSGTSPLNLNRALLPNLQVLPKKISPPEKAFPSSFSRESNFSATYVLSSTLQPFTSLSVRGTGLMFAQQAESFFVAPVSTWYQQSETTSPSSSCSSHSSSSQSSISFANFFLVKALSSFNASLDCSFSIFFSSSTTSSGTGSILSSITTNFNLKSGFGVT